MFKKLLIFLLFLHVAISKKNFKFENHYVCGRGQNNPIKMHNMTITYSHENGFTFDIFGELYRDLISKIMRIEIDIIRCLSKEALDTCEKLTKLQSPGLCRLLDMKGAGWDEIRDRFEPPMKCPLKRGTYIGKGVTLNPDMFKLFPIDGYYWKINGSLFEGKTYLASLCIACTVIKA